MGRSRSLSRELAKLQSLTFEIADLPDGQLATVSSSKITLDETAAGYGWFFDATPSDDNEFEVTVEDKELQTTELSAAQGRVDLLTVLCGNSDQQCAVAKGEAQGPQEWLMEATLEPGTRRAPAFKERDVGKAVGPKGSALAAQPSRMLHQPNQRSSGQQVAR